MTEIWRSKFAVGTFLTAFMVTLGYEVKQDFFKAPPVVLVVISFIISTYLANFIIDKSLDWKLGRKLIFRRTWVEGHWFLSTTTLENNPNSISQSGICYITYEGDTHVLTVITYRKKYDNNMHTGFSSTSDLVAIRSSDLKFTNLFTLSNGTIETKGITTGKFFNDGYGIYPNIFEGQVTLFNEGSNRNQRATKIPDKIVKKLMKEKREQWKDEYLKLSDSGQLSSIIS